MPDPKPSEADYLRTLYASHRLRDEGRRHEQRRLQAFERLVRLAHQNAIVSSHLRFWESGQFESWEAMLLELSLTLGEQYERLLDHAQVDLSRMVPSPLIVEIPHGPDQSPVAG
jgi:hypothetical protein